MHQGQVVPPHNVAKAVLVAAHGYHETDTHDADEARESVRDQDDPHYREGERLDLLRGNGRRGGRSSGSSRARSHSVRASNAQVHSP